MNYIFQFASQQTLSFTLIIAMFLMAIVFLFTKFKVKWDGFKPIFENRSEDKLLESQKAIADLEEKLKFSQSPDFYKKTDNGEYIGFFVARKPYICIWADGNWNTEEHHDIFDTFSRLWEKENEIIIFGKNPNLPSDIMHIIETKARDLPELTIFCSSKIFDYFNKYFKDYESVKIIQRG